MGSVQDNAHKDLSEETELNQSIADMFVASDKSGRLFDYLKEKQEELEHGNS